MTKITLKVARIGNSRGVRIPAPVLDRLGIGDSVIMEERADGILLRPNGTGQAKLTWAQTAAAMADAREDWSEFDAPLADGLETIPWIETGAGARRVAEQQGDYKGKSRRKRGRAK